jgi:hypothetical protein
VGQIHRSGVDPYSQIFPSAIGDDYDRLLASVKRLKKLRYSVIVYQNMILDGNQRIMACREARVEPKCIEFSGTDEQAMELVWDLNFARRHMTPSIKATAVAKATLLFEVGRPEKSGAGAQLTEKFADKVGVGLRTVVDAKKVLRGGTNEEKKALESGEAKAKPLAEKIRQREKQSKSGEFVDDMGYPIPPNAAPYWHRKYEAKNVLNQIGAARGQVRKLLPDDPMWSAENLNGVLADLSAAYNRFTAAVPSYVCPYCKGNNTDSTWEIARAPGVNRKASCPGGEALPVPTGDRERKHPGAQNFVHKKGVLVLIRGSCRTAILRGLLHRQSTRSTLICDSFLHPLFY